ncbi:hypothetical protein Dsin_007771 [Dipteronia sinensis]|uniref:Uncharacterized protein n=1 Tax=Dipteronia sinensis TaxID=43782 RepID=A0AAE0B252_9ROSI|nr:hypothetical protein Dsin_007771 [Dipteronia sinensis]
MTSPILTDAISPALDRGADLTTSVMQGQYCTPGNLQLQQSQFLDSAVNNEYGRLSLLNRHVNRTVRTPIAVQALPAAFQTPSPQQRPGTSFNSLTPNGSSISSQAALSVANGYIPTTTDIERQLQQQQQLRYSRSQMNTFMRPDMASSPLQYHSAAQVGLPASGTLPDTNQVSSGLSSENQNLHQQQAVNLRRPQFRSQSPSSINVSSPISRSSIRKGEHNLGSAKQQVREVAKMPGLCLVLSELQA